MLKVSFKNYDENLENIYKFMYPLWHEVYKEIIPEKQIDFLLHKYFDVENIRTYIKDNYIYEKIILDENVVGLICYKLFDNYVYLDIYLDYLYNFYNENYNVNLMFYYLYMVLDYYNLNLFFYIPLYHQYKYIYLSHNLPHLFDNLSII